MLNELKILFSNIKNFRHLITEGVADNDIVDAIQNHEYIYIYYAGDNTIERGYRTVRPFVLGTSTAGNKVLRAWQDKGKSDSLRADSLRKRPNHEFHRDNDGKEKPGWRLFLVDKISSSYLTGKKFVDSNGKVMIPPQYNPNDKQMTNIVASLSPIEPQKTQTKGLDNISEPDVVANKVDKSQFDVQTNRFKQFYNAGKTKRDATARDVENLYNVARKVYKKSPNNYLVAVNNKGDFHLVDMKNEKNIPPEAIVGKLTNLYSKLVLPNKSKKPEEDNFIKQQKDTLLKNQSQEVSNQNIVKEITNNPIVRKTFFK